MGQNANEETWTQLHELGLKTTSIEEKQNYYEALAHATDPKLVARTSADRPRGRAANQSRTLPRGKKSHGKAIIPNWRGNLPRRHMKELMAKADALAATRYPPSLFTFFSDPTRIAEIQTYAQKNLPPASASEKTVAQAVDEIGFPQRIQTATHSAAHCMDGQEPATCRKARHAQEIAETET